jgi:hypothetical protein
VYPARVPERHGDREARDWFVVRAGRTVAAWLDDGRRRDGRDRAPLGFASLFAG